VEKQLYMYNVNFQTYEDTLWAIESRALFGRDFSEKVFFSDRAVNPSVSPFIKNRVEIHYKAKSFDELVACVEKDESIAKDFIIKYIKLESGDPYAASRKDLCKDLGSKFKEYPNFEAPSIVFAVFTYNDQWYFGVLKKNDGLWRQHNDRPHTFSNSLKINMAKVLINVAGQGDTNKTIVDPCCGAGTVLLEGCYAGHEMTGSDINYKMFKSAEKNLAYFGYRANLKHRPIQEIEEHFDCSIVDLPYGLYSKTSSEAQQSIIEHAKRISDRTVIVSSEDIVHMLNEVGLTIVDSCEIIKSVNRKFTRYIWICE